MPIPPIPVVDTHVGIVERLRAVGHRLTWRLLLGSALATLALFFAAHFLFGPLFGVADYPPEIFVSHTVAMLCEMACLLVAMLLAEDAVRRGAPRLRTYALAVVTGAAAGSLLQYAVREALGLRMWMSLQRWEIAVTQPALIFFDVCILGGVTIFAYASIRASLEAARRTQAAELARVQAARRTLESRLQAMQARVEPQFLFNTLAQVGELYERDASRGGEMLDNLITYLRAALPHLRESASTLGKEIELAQAYLNIMRARLGDRLSFSFDIPDDTRQARMPAMVLLPLIDHALVHGFSPQRMDSALSIAASASDGRLRLSITDSGGGFVAENDAADLRSIAERIVALYDAEGRFALERLDAERTRAVLDIPFEREAA